MSQEAVISSLSLPRFLRAVAISFCLPLHIKVVSDSHWITALALLLHPPAVLTEYLQLRSAATGAGCMQL